jgi:hypothetical protein
MQRSKVCYLAYLDSFSMIKNKPSGALCRLIPILSVPACCLWMEILFFIVLQRKTLMKNEVKEDGRVAVSALVGGTPH